MTTNPETLLTETAQTALKLALGFGAQQATAAATHGREVEVAWRDGQLERLHEASSRGLSVELYVDGRYAAVSTSDLRPEALRDFLRDAVDMTRALQPDPYRTLPDPALYPDRALALDDSALQSFDPSGTSLTALQRREQAQALEVAARGVPGADKILSVTTGVSDSASVAYRCDSQGFEGFRHGSAFWRSCDVSVQDPDGRRPEESDYSGARHLADVESPEIVGRRAAERTLQRIGAQKLPSGPRTLVVDARTAGRLVSALLGPLSGASLQQKRSFYEGRETTAIGSALLDVSDNPHLPRAFASRYFDGEGLRAVVRPVFARGVPATVFVDTYYAKKLGRAPTTGRTSNLDWTLGDRDQPGLLADVGEGILVTGFLGGNSNATTGDFSLGIQGFAIRGGQIAEPVAEMNFAGSHLQLWHRLTALGNDPYRLSPLRTPTLVFAGADVAGS